MTKLLKMQQSRIESNQMFVENTRTIFTFITIGYALTLCAIVALACLCLYFHKRNERCRRQQKDRRLLREAFDRDIESQSAFANIDEFPAYADLIFNVYAFYHDMKQNRGKTNSQILTNTMFASYRFIKQYYPVTKDVFTIAKILIGHEAVIEVESQSSSYLKTARNTLDSWKDCTSSDIAAKMQRVLCGLVTCGLTKEFGLKFTEAGFNSFFSANVSKVRVTSPNDLLYSIADLVVTFAEVGYECFADKSLQPVLIRDRATRDWIISYQDIITKLDNIPVTANFDAPTMLEEIDHILGRGNALQALSPRHIGPLWKILMTRRSKLLREHNVSSTRRPPFSVLVHGSPGIGKSSVTQLIGTIFHQTVTQSGIYPDLTWDPKQNMYTYNCDDQYWSGYTGAKQWFVCMDDLARENVKQVSSGQATSVRDVITVVNSVGIATTQAAIEDKGCIPLVPKLVVATTNTKDLNAYHAVAEPAAVLRRFPFVIKPVLKPEFVDPQSGMMKKLDGMVRDAWLFHVETVRLTVASDETVTTHYDTYYPEPERKLCTGAELSSFLRTAILKHEASSTVMLNSLTQDEDVSMCEHGVLSYFECNDCQAPLLFFDAKDDVIQSQSWTNFFRSETRTERVLRYFFRGLSRFTPNWLYDQVINKLVEKDTYQAAFIRMIYATTEDNVPTQASVSRFFFIQAVSGLSMYVIINMIVNYFMPDPSESEPDRDIQSHSNIWELMQDKNSQFVVPKTSKPNNNHELINTIRKGTFNMSIQCGDLSPQFVTCFALKDGWYVTVQHPFSKDYSKWKCIASYENIKFSLTPKNAFYLTDHNIKRLPNDLIMFHSGNILPRKSLFSFLPKKKDNVGRTVEIFDRSLSSGTVGNGTTNRLVNLTYRDTYGHTITGTFMDGERLDRSPKAGDCGSIILSFSAKGVFISGIHCAGSPSNNNNRMIVSQISQEIFKSDSPTWTMSNLGSSDHINRGSRNSGRLVEPHPSKGVHHWAENAKGLILGSYLGRSSGSSSVKKSIICSAVEEKFGITNEFSAPVMIPKKEKGVWLNPFTIAATQQGSVSPHFNDEEVQLVEQAFLKDLCKDTEWLKDCSVVSQHVAINGVDGDSYINSLPMSTSGGFHFIGPKRQYFTLVSEEHSQYHIPSKEVLDMIHDIKFAYYKDERFMPIFQGTLKDEPLKKSKVDTGKTRVFTACDVAFSIVVREQYLTITKAIMTHNFITECAVSMNCYSIDWDNLYRYLTAFGKDRMIAGDYQAFDKNMPPLMIRAAFDVLDTLRSKFHPLSARDKAISNGIATDISFPVTNMNGDVIQFFGGNSSGHPLTTIINSVVNSMYVRLAYFRSGLDLSTFSDNVNLMTLGDDNIMGSKIDSFNHTVIVDQLAKKGIPYTMADKESKSVPFINISECDFLKRTFKYCAISDRYIGPLALKSSFKSLCMFVDRGNISHEEQLAQSYLSARREWSLHGREIFDSFTFKMSEIFSEFPEVQRFFIQSHYYNYDKTLEWVLGTDESLDRIMSLDE